MMRLLLSIYDMECRLFQEVNRHFDKKLVNLFFRTITHLGGATFTIATILLLMLFTTNSVKLAAMASAISLAISHIPVHIVKKLYPRKRPYITLEKTQYHTNPLKDHSFPSGHTTAIFSVIIPFVLFFPPFLWILLPIALSVGLSRIYLGLHYPTDVLAGALLGTLAGTLSFYLMTI